MSDKTAARRRQRAAKLLRDAGWTECLWTETDDAIWESACGSAFALYEGTPSDNSMRFCCYCGGLLSEKRHEVYND